MVAMSDLSSLPAYASRDLVSQRLPLIFPEGTPNRNYCVRDVAANTVFTMLYIGAVEGFAVSLSRLAELIELAAAAAGAGPRP
jgi:hypothetical protein